MGTDLIQTLGYRGFGFWINIFHFELVIAFVLGSSFWFRIGYCAKSGGIVRKSGLSCDFSFYRAKLEV
ncbi:hypothetical protein, partial [Bacillus norwichensis]|uniref:hypothetical protein n=1 Tax=Bacillus norwichensis TaxID=2762217 RepID=UPI001CD8F1E9